MVPPNEAKTVADKLSLELRRGVIVLAVLAQLQQEHYAYSLRKALADKGVGIDEGTLYPLVRRLEKQGLLLSEWREEGSRKKRFYRLAPEGLTVLNQLRAQWQELNVGIDALLQGVDT